MNKTIIININGIVFHIEENAYEVLRSYMTDIKRHFSYSADSDEIVTDIENRLCEMFSEKLASQNKQVIVVQDVTEVTAQMGSIHDFAGEEENPVLENNYGPQRKLFRDIDEKNAAGVCAGLAHYFLIEVKWVRVLFVLTALLSGLGLLVYVLLWIILPEARTRQEKMAMKGEPINLHGFKRTFDEELEGSNHFTANTLQKTGETLEEIITSLASFALKLFKIFVKIIAGFVVLAGAIALIGLIGGLIFSFGFWNHKELNEFPFNTINAEFKSPIYLGAFLLLVIPLTALISFALRIVFNRKTITRTGAFSMLILWLTGLSICIYYGSKVASDFKEDARFEQETELKEFPVYYLKLNPDKFLSKEDSLDLHLTDSSFSGKILIDNDDNELSQVKRFELDIVKSEDSTVTIVKEFRAQGKTFEAALKTARKTKYRFLQSDSSLSFDKYLYLGKNSPFRDQRITVTLSIPVNTRLVIERDLDSHLDNFDLWDCMPEDKEGKRTSEWIMTNEGLKCTLEKEKKEEQENY